MDGERTAQQSSHLLFVELKKLEQCNALKEEYLKVLLMKFTRVSFYRAGEIQAFYRFKPLIIKLQGSLVKLAAIK